MGRLALPRLGIVALAALLQGCGAGSESTARTGTAEDLSREPAPDAIHVPPLRDRVITAEHLRRAVLQGVGRDYLGGTQVGPPSFGLCLQRGLGALLDEQNLRALALVYRRPAGQQLTAQALSDLAAPVGARCGGRRFVPMPIEASMAFRAGRLPAGGIASRLAYGPYLGVTCLARNSVRCDSVGVDLELRRDAAAVTAHIGGRMLRLQTPGVHSGLPARDWGGRLNWVGLARRDSPFYVEPYGKSQTTWAGYPPVFLPVALEIAYPQGKHVEGRLPSVSLAPGSG